MYNLPDYKEQDPTVVKAFMKQHPFAMLIGTQGAFPVATQVPFLIEERKGQLFLLGHIMRNTDHHKAFEVNPNALCVFTGAHSYVSARWYSEPQTASTWNYMSVHAKGSIQFMDADGLLSVLERTTSLFEDDPKSPASFHKLSPDYIEKLSKAIVGIEVAVTSIDHVFKLSQNRDKESYANIVTQLEKGDADAQAISKEMAKRANQI